MIYDGLNISLQGYYLHIGSLRQHLTLHNYLSIYRWTPHLIPLALYTEQELKKIHRGFVHPSVRATYKQLLRSCDGIVQKKILKELTKIKDDCTTCKINSLPPRRFKLTIGDDDLQLNHKVIVDTMFLKNKPVIHLIDENIHFVGASFLKNQLKNEIWN